MLNSVLDPHFKYNSGGTQRYYTGFGVPDGIVFPLSIAARGGVGNLVVCDTLYIEILGSPYDYVIVRTVDPRDPFPGGVPFNWRNHIDYITDLTAWYEEPMRERERRLERWLYFGILRNWGQNMIDGLHDGFRRFRGEDIPTDWPGR